MKKTRTHIVLSIISVVIITYLTNYSLIFCKDNNASQAQQFDLNIDKSQEHTSRNKRMRKPQNKSEQKRKRNRTYKDFEYNELLAAKKIQVERNNISVAIKYLDQLMKLCNDITLLSEHMLEMADLFFLDSQFQKAAHLYTQYCTLYPGSKQQEYALYRSIVSSFACILSVDRDQTKTEDTVALTEMFLKQDHFVRYRDDVAHIQMQCYKQLAASECNICTFYITRSKLAAAEKRLKKIRSHWLPKIPTLEPDIIALEAQLTEQKEMINALNNKTLLRQGFGGQALAHNKKAKHLSKRF